MAPIGLGHKRPGLLPMAANRQKPALVKRVRIARTDLDAFQGGIVMSIKHLLPAVLLAAAAPAMAGSAHANPSDAAVTAKVKSNIDRLLGPLPISVSTVGGVVHLRGDVPGGVRVDQAQDVASRVSGVKEVDNELQAERDS
jgi:hypothetical protein